MDKSIQKILKVRRAAVLLWRVSIRGQPHEAGWASTADARQTWGRVHNPAVSPSPQKLTKHKQSPP